MSRINTNVPSLQAVHRLQINHADLNLRLERLSTGLRINRGRDDPAGLIVSENLRAEIRTIQQAIENSTRANNVIATAEGAMNEVSALLLELQSLVVATANEAGLSAEEVRANQLEIDSILFSIDRIANTTKFGSERLLDGSKAYTVSGVDPAALASVSLYAARLPPNTTREITVTVTQSAETARVAYVGANPGGVSVTSAATVELRGNLGSEVLSFASGMTLAEVVAAINSVTGVTGVSATVSTPAGPGTASALILHSTSFGSDAFVSVEPLSGGFVESGNAGREFRDHGVDAGVLVDGQTAAVQGFRADLRSLGLDARIDLSPQFGQALSSTTFNISGGGSIFQITPEVSTNGQVFVGLGSVRTTKLGSPITGLLFSLRAGETNDLKSKNFDAAQTIVEEAISQVASYRGRLGSVQRNHIDPNLNSQRVTLENVTASESTIRDADMAVEVSALTRAQILVQATQSTLQIANTVPNVVLGLLG